MKKIFKIGYTVILLGLLVSSFAWAVADIGDFILPPLETPLSEDGAMLFQGQAPAIFVDNPNKPSNELRHIPPPIASRDQAETATATFSITYIPSGSTDLWGQSCGTFPESAKVPFNAAAAIWGNLLKSSVPVTIKACWANLGSSSILGYSGGGTSHRNFTNAPKSNTWYSASLANSLAGSDLDPNNWDMHITYNSNFSWYYGTDGNTPSTQHDLMSVVLHEIGHGLNFAGTASYSSTSGQGSLGSSGSFGIYDTFMKDGSGAALTSYSNPSVSLGTALRSGDLWFHGSNAMSANGGARVKMYAPSTWAGGSSYSHLDYTTFNNTVNQLMVYAISAGEAIHDPGPVTNGLLKDLGWAFGTGGTGRSEIVGIWSDGIWYWNPATSGWTKTYSAVPEGTRPITVGDITGDGKADIIACWNSGLWYQNGSTLGWTNVYNTAPGKVGAGDITGDGRAEIVGTWSDGIWYWNPATSGWAKTYSAIPEGPIAVGDITGDGKADIVACWSSGLWYQNGSTLGWTKVYSTAPSRVAAGDVTGN